MFSNFKEYKQYNSEIIIDLLKNKNISLEVKEYELEKLSNLMIDKLYDEKYVNNKKVIKFLNKLLNIDWLNIAGKTYLVTFFSIISTDIFVKYVLIKVLFRLKYIYCYSADYLKTMLKYAVLEYILNKNIVIINKGIICYKNYQIKRFEKQKNKNEIERIIIEKNLERTINKKVEMDIEILEKSLAYIVEFLKENKIIKYNIIESRFNVEDSLEITNQEAILVLMNRWPLLIPGKKYEKEEEIYKGGYYLNENKLILNILNYNVSSEIQITDNLLKIIDNLQTTKYKLIENVKIIKFIEKVEEYLTVEFLKEKGKEKYLEDWYACYQYLVLKRGEIKEIYYPYIIDFRGRIYNGINYGLNPTTNKLSRTLINFGKIKLTEEMKLNIKKYICSSFKIALNEFNKILEINLDYENKENLEILIDLYSLKNIVLLLDWKYNVIENNETEILIELDACQSGFQVLSMLSNDNLCMKTTNLIKSENRVDLYSLVLETLYNKVSEKKKKWFNIINRNFVKRIIMTIPYGSTYEGQMHMLVDEYNKQYSLKYLIKYNSLPLIIENEVLLKDEILENEYVIDEELLNQIIKLNKAIEKGKGFSIKEIERIEDEIIKNLKKYMFKYILQKLNEITNDLYPNIIKFTKELKLLDINKIETDYCIYPIIYYKEIEEKIVIKKGTYTKSYIDYTKLDIRKSKTSLIANICQGMGDSFILQKFIESSNIKIYPIHDALLCSVNEIDNVKLEILKTYKYVYNYYLNYKDFQGININREEYNIDSLNIYDV